MENTRLKSTHIVIKKTPYYEVGPQQGRDPEGHLKRGTHVIIVIQSESYPRVRTEDGSISGYVLSTDIAPIESAQQLDMLTKE